MSLIFKNICLFWCREFTYSGNRSSWSWSNERANKNRKQRAEFLSRSGAMKTRGALSNIPMSPSACYDSPVKGTCWMFPFLLFYALS